MVSDITPLASLVNLEMLLINMNYSEDISALRNLNTLTILGAQMNQIKDVHALGGLSGLRELYLDSIVLSISLITNTISTWMSEGTNANKAEKTL